MGSTFPCFRRTLFMNWKSFFLGREINTSSILARTIHGSAASLVRKNAGLQKTGIETGFEKKPIEPTKLLINEKHDKLTLAPIPDPSLVEYANDCFENPATFLGSLGETSFSEFATKRPNKSLPEVVFMGASNSGKSTLINCLLNTKGLARTSKKPVGSKFVLVDMPGYGHKSRHSWGEMVEAYLQEGVSEYGNLKRVFLLIESKRNFKCHDKMILELFERLKVPYQVLITKADKLPPKLWDEKYLTPSTSELAFFLRHHGQNLADQSLNFLSPLKARFGIPQLRCQILNCVGCIPARLKDKNDISPVVPADLKRKDLIFSKEMKKHLFKTEF